VAAGLVSQSEAGGSERGIKQVRAGMEFYVLLTADIAAILLDNLGREHGEVNLAAGTVFVISHDAGTVSERQGGPRYYGIRANGESYRVERAALDAKLAPKGE